MGEVICPKCNKSYAIIQKEKHTNGGKILFSCLECKTPVMIESLFEIKDPEISLTLKPIKVKHKSGEALKKEIVKSLKNVPPMPKIISEALEMLSDPDSGIEDLSSILETDQSVVTNILKLANSAYYGLRGNVSSAHMACVVLGKNTLREVIIMANVSEMMGASLKGYGFATGELWLHSVASGIASRIVAEKGSPDLSNDAYIAGLVHDLGKIILDRFILERKVEFDESMRKRECLDFQAEKKVLGFDHAEIASEICNKWNFPKDISLAIKYHHYPSRFKKNRLSYIVHMGDFIARLCGFGYGRDDLLHKLEDETTDILLFVSEDISDTTSGLIESMQKYDMALS